MLRLLAFAFVLGLSACTRAWDDVPLPLAGTTEPVIYGRRPLSNGWVGTEQERRLRVGDRGAVTLPVQMSESDTVAVYAVRGSAGHRLYMVDLGSRAVIDLPSLTVSERALGADSLGPLVGLVAPEGGSLRFIPGPEAGGEHRVP